MIRRCDVADCIAPAQRFVYCNEGGGTSYVLHLCADHDLRVAPDDTDGPTRHPSSGSEL